MVEKSTYVLLLIVGVVFMLSFKDLMLIRSTQAETKTNKQVNKKPNGQVILDNFENSEESDARSDARSDTRSDAKRDTSNIDSSDDADEHDFDSDNVHEHDHEHDESNVKLNDELNAKKIPSLKMKSNVQTLKFMFCYSCGYRNAFEQYSQIIQARYPELKIVGENYPPSGVKLYLAQFLSTFKIVVIGSIIFGFNPFAQFNLPTPAVFNWATQNKFYASIMLFFISNSIETHLISTGAFEIYLNDMQIWSKLASDRIPHEKELMQILDMNFNFESEKNAAFGNANTKF